MTSQYRHQQCSVVFPWLLYFIIIKLENKNNKAETVRNLLKWYKLIF